MSQGEVEDIDFEITFYENLLERCPAFEQAMMALGDLYTKKGDFTKGLKLDRALAALRPEDPYVHYNLACSYSLLRQIDEALDAMRAALRNGYEDFAHLAKDPDLEYLKQDQRFRVLLQQKKLKGVT